VDRDSEWKIAADKDSMDFTYRATGVRGQITGWGYDVATLDDLLKSGLEAKSDTVRNTVHENVVSAVINRLSPIGILIAMQARLHTEDPIGKLLAMDQMKWLRLHLPATNDTGQEAWLDDGYSGEKTMFPPYSALWPSRYPKTKLDLIRSTFTPYYWSAQFSQVPSMGDLSYFDVTRFPRYQAPRDVQKLWIGVDAANTETKSGSCTAFVCLGHCGDHLKVLGVHRGRWRQDRMADELLGFNNAMGRLIGIAPEAVIIERAAGGYGLIDHLGLSFPIVPVYPQGSKEERAGVVCWLPNQGNVQLPVSAPWLAAFSEELQNFPLGSNKDSVDAFVHALAWEIRKNTEFKMDKLVYVDHRTLAHQQRMVDAENFLSGALDLHGGIISPELDDVDGANNP
jgi:phage terminase large subunit-like protein